MQIKKVGNSQKGTDVKKGKIKTDKNNSYNIGIAKYDDWKTTPKSGEWKFLPHILSGNWVPTFNGMPGIPVDKDRPVFKNIDDALKNNAIDFGMKQAQEDVPLLCHYAQNKTLLAGGYPLTGKVDSEGKPVLYSIFITAAKENAAKIHKNIVNFLNSPYSAGIRYMVEALPQPWRLTYPQVAEVEISEEIAEEIAE